ncbi:hypothetical protein E2C01_071562 [Portunus trituberculatus]|uniref:Uncharacterized protein n=1 Tax=Portunus trituberculatus TaxID=210409 RepID=A0A5B7I6J5_PORTR|nr:hypothetical protein [Portunus trituberculatus]
MEALNSPAVQSRALSVRRPLELALQQVFSSHSKTVFERGQIRKPLYWAKWRVDRREQARPLSLPHIACSLL